MKPPCTLVRGTQFGLRAANGRQSLANATANGGPKGHDPTNNQPYEVNYV